MRRGRGEAKMPDHAISATLESLDTQPVRSGHHNPAAQATANRPVMTDRVNESSSRESKEDPNSRGKALTGDSYYQDKINRRIASQRAARLAQENAPHHGLDSLAARTKSTAPVPALPAAPAANDSPGFDLIQNRFARLGGDAPERSAVGGTSRTDRQAAARARVEQKRLERQREKAAGRVLDKENMVP